MKPIQLKNNQVLEISRKKANFNLNSGMKAVLIVKKTSEVSVNVDKGAYLQVICFIRHQREFNSQMNINLQGIGAEVKISGTLHGYKHDKHRINVILDHQTKQTKGDILIRGVYQDRAVGRFYGLIKIDKKSREADSYMANNVLLFDQAVAISKPQLEIMNDEVKASHNSTTSRINDEQMFYLNSRGINQQLAEKMIISGFLNKAIERFPRKVLPLIVKHVK